MDMLEILVERLREIEAHQLSLGSENSSLREGNAKILSENAELRQKVASLTAQMEELRRQLNKDSSNSSKPSSSDPPWKKKARSLREKSGRRPGGQPGHSGTTLRRVEKPDHVRHRAAETCLNCARSLKRAKEVGKPESRQVFDLPEDIRLEVTDNIGHTLECPHCGAVNPPPFPDEAKTSVQYGPRIKGAAVNLVEHQHVAMNRSVEILKDFFNASVSPGSVVSFIGEAAERATPAMELVEDAIAAASNAHFDETGCRQGKKCKWLHAAASACLVALRFHEKRGREAIEDFGILPRFKGFATHDFWKSYLSDELKDVIHNFCRAHLMRELEAIAKGYEGQSWAGRLKKFFSKAKRATDAAREAGSLALDPKALALLEAEYRKLIKSGLRANGLAPPDLKRGNIGEKTTPKNILRRLVEYEGGILLFIRDLRAPFDNNEAERVFRVAKIKMKVSGCFRSEWGAKAFATLRGYIATARKNGIGALQALIAAFHGTPFIPDVALPE